MKTFNTALKLFLFFTVLTGLVYPIAITAMAQILFPAQANGNLLYKDHTLIGSKLIGQPFNGAGYFTSRPSATDYNPLPSGGSNKGLTNSLLKQQVQERIQGFRQTNRLDSTTLVPSEMLFASASGLDPHISKQAALLQINRIASARNLDNTQRQQLIDCVGRLTEKSSLLAWGTERVNVLLLNLEVDKLP
jgi:potassium-transporting ATPase KdpC subunit